MEVLIVCLVALVIGLCNAFLMGKFGPWGKLAQKFSTSSVPAIWRQTMVSGTIGFGRYRNALRIELQKDGFCLAANCLFPWHSPLFIPWNCIYKTEYQERFGLKSIILTIGHPLLTTIKLPASAMESPYFPFQTSNSNAL